MFVKFIAETLSVDSTEIDPLDPKAPTPLAILVVDDDPSVSAFLRAALVGMGHRVTNVSDCASALAKLNDYGNGVDAIILDLKLPDGDGERVADIALTRMPVPSVVFISGFSDELGQVTDSHPGSVALPKPFGLADLERALSKLAGA